MSSRSSVRRSLRRIRPAQHRAQLLCRDRSQLSFLRERGPYPSLLLDTTVYIDDLRGDVSSALKGALTGAALWHSTVTECELAAIAGLLDPAHSDTSRVIEQMVATVERRPAHRIVNPDRDVWPEAGIAAGLLSRLQQYGKAEQRRVLNDALILLSAAKTGLAVLTRNVADYDLLTQLLPHTAAVFYDI